MSPPVPQCNRPTAAFIRQQRREASSKSVAGLHEKVDESVAGEKVEVALAITGGGLVPPLEAYGIFRGLHRKELHFQRRGAAKDGGSGDGLQALDNFDCISGASGGYIASTMYCYSKKKPYDYLDCQRPTDPKKITKTDFDFLGLTTYGSLLTSPYPGRCGGTCAGPFNDGPAMCCPCPGGGPCCVPGPIWAFCIATGLGYVPRSIGCGKIVGPAFWPRWGVCTPGAWACGDSSWWIEFMSRYFLLPIGVDKGKFTAATEEQAALLAEIAKRDGKDGQHVDDYAFPAKWAPTPVGIATMASLSNLSSQQYSGPVFTWVLKAWNEMAADKAADKKKQMALLAQSSEAPEDEDEMMRLTPQEITSHGSEIIYGDGVKKALEKQWADKQPGGAKGLSFIPYVFTPQTAETMYHSSGDLVQKPTLSNEEMVREEAANKPPDNIMIIPALGPSLLCGGYDKCCVYDCGGGWSGGGGQSGTSGWGGGCGKLGGGGGGVGQGTCGGGGGMCKNWLGCGGGFCDPKTDKSDATLFQCGASAGKTNLVSVHLGELCAADGNGSERWCCGVLGATAVFQPLKKPSLARDFVLPPQSVLCGQLPGAHHLSPETTIGIGGDALGAPSAILPCCVSLGSFSCLPGRCLDVSLRIKTADERWESEYDTSKKSDKKWDQSRMTWHKVDAEASETCLFTDGGMMEDTCVAPTVAKGATRIVSVITNINAGLFKGTGKGGDPWYIDKSALLQVFSLFGELHTAPDKELKMLEAKATSCCAGFNPGLWPQLFGECRTFCGASNKVASAVPSIPFGIINQIFEGGKGDNAFDVKETSIVLNKQGLDPTKIKIWDPKANKFAEKPVEELTALEVLTAQYEFRQNAGKAIAATVKGLLVMDNPYYGTKSHHLGKRRKVDITFVLMAAPRNWMEGINENPQLNPKHEEYTKKLAEAIEKENPTLTDPFDVFKVGPAPFRGRSQKFKEEAFPYYLQAFPYVVQSIESVNLAGYMGDWIIDDIWEDHLADKSLWPPINPATDLGGENVRPESAPKKRGLYGLRGSKAN